MNLKFNIAPTLVFSKPYNPTSLEIWVGSTDIIPEVLYSPATDIEPEVLAQPEIKLVNIETETVEILENGKRLEKRQFKMPLDFLSQAISGYDLVTGKAVINVPVLNAIIAEFDIAIV